MSSLAGVAPQGRHTHGGHALDAPQGQTHRLYRRLLGEKGRLCEY